MKISGEDFEFGTILEGTEIICNYTIDDAGSINLEVEIPAVNESFYKNFYSREEGQVNFDKAASKLHSDGKNLLDQVRELGRAIEDDADYEKLQRAGEVASTAINANRTDNDREELKHIEEDLQAAKKILADIRERNRESIRRDDLDGWRSYYESNIKKFAKPQEINQLENLFDRAETLIEREDSAFEDAIKEIVGFSYGIVIRDDRFIIDLFNSQIKKPEDFDDQARFYRLAAAGKNAIAQRDFNELRRIVNELYSIGRNKGDEFLTANIIKA